MPFYIVQFWQRRYDVNLVEADNQEKAKTADREYLGYYHAGDNFAEPEVYGPFQTKEEALASEKAWVEDI